MVQRSTTIRLKIEDQFSSVLTKFNQELEKSSGTLGKVSVVVDKTTGELKKFTLEAARAGQASQKASTDVQHLGRTADNSFRQVTTSAGHMALGLAAGLIGFNVLASGVYQVGNRLRESVGQFMELETALSRVHGLAGASSKQLALWSDDVRRISSETARSQTELAQALYFISSSGISAEHTIGLLNVSAKGAASGLGSTADVARLLAAAMNAYGEQNLTATRATDILVAAVKGGAAEASEMANSLGRVLPIAAALKVPFDQISAAVAAMTLQGLDANEAVTALRGIFVAMVNPSTDLKNALKAGGLSMEDLRATLREKGLLYFLRMLSEALEGNIEATRELIPDNRALTGFLNLTGAEAEKLVKIFDDTATASGNAGQAFVDTETDARKLERAQNDLNNIAMDFGKTVLPAIVSMLGIAGTGFRKLGENIDADSNAFLGLASAVNSGMRAIGMPGVGPGTAPKRQDWAALEADILAHGGLANPFGPVAAGAENATGPIVELTEKEKALAAENQKLTADAKRLQAALSRLGEPTERTGSAASKAASAIRDQASAVRDLSSAAQKQLSIFENARLPGETAISNQIRDIQLDIIRYRRLTYDSATADAAYGKIAELERWVERLRLEEQEFQLLHEKARATAEQPQEMTFDQIVQGIISTRAEIEVYQNTIDRLDAAAKLAADGMKINTTEILEQMQAALESIPRSEALLWEDARRQAEAYFASLNASHALHYSDNRYYTPPSIGAGDNTGTSGPELPIEPNLSLGVPSSVSVNIHIPQGSYIDQKAASALWGVIKREAGKEFSLLSGMGR